MDEPRVGNSAASRLGTSLALLAIVAGALLLRLHNLDQWGLWDDELFTVRHAIELADFVNPRALAWLPHRIGFELAGVDVANLDPEEIWTWRAAGLTEWTMRAPVALLGALTILVLCFVGHRSLGARPTLWLCLLLALSPWHLWMSQVCRFYMQLFLLYNLALLLYYQATMDGRLGARRRGHGVHGARLLHLADRPDDRRGVRGRHCHELPAPPAYGHAPRVLGHGNGGNRHLRGRCPARLWCRPQGSFAVGDTLGSRGRHNRFRC